MPLRALNKPLFFLVGILLLANVSFALPADSLKKINITAASSIFNYKIGTNTYEGDVKIDQGSTHLTADRVVTQNNERHKIVKAIAYGIKRPAEYTTLPKDGDALLHAKAKVIQFFPLTSTVVLEGDVVVTQAENSFQGPLIIYNMKDQVITAPASKLGRATLVIESAQLK